MDRSTILPILPTFQYYSISRIDGSLADQEQGHQRFRSHGAFEDGPRSLSSDYTTKPLGGIGSYGQFVVKIFRLPTVAP
jgi:hypothetical protein